MLQKATIVWAAAFGAVAAVGAGGVIWRLHGFAPTAPAQSTVAAPAAPAASAPRSMAAVAPSADVPSVAPTAVSPAPAQTAPTAAAPLAAPTQPKPAEQADVPRPQFDIVRVEASGEAVIAGHAAPKAKIAVTDHGAIVAEADADATGQFVVLPPAFKPGGHALGLTARVGDGAPVQSPGVVGVDVPLPAQAAAEPPKMVAAAAPKAAPAPAVVRKLETVAAQSAANPSALQNSAVRGEASKAVASDATKTSVVAMAATGAAPPRSSEPTTTNVAPPPAAGASKQVAPKADALAPAATVAKPADAAKPAEPVLLARADAAAPTSATPRTAITGVAADEAGRMVTTGVAAPGALLRLYLNGSFLASVTAGVKGTWSLTVEHGMTGGAYAIRADEIDRGKGAVVSRAEVPFNYPQHIADTATLAKPATPADAAGAAPPAAPSDQPKANATTVVAAAAPQAAAAAQSRALSVAAAQPSSPPASSTAVQPPALVASAALTDASVQSAAPKPVAASGDALAGAPPPEAASNAVVKLIDTHKVVPGDNLWDISWHVYGNGLRYTQIYAANSNQIRNPQLIYPGQIFVLPQATPF